MKFGIIKSDRSSKKITAFIESYEKLKAHLKMLYPEVMFLEGHDERSVRKNEEYPIGRQYMLFQNMKATLYQKEEFKDVGTIWTAIHIKMREICSWELVPLDIVSDSDSEDTSSLTRSKTVEFHNFNVKSFYSGSMCIVYGKYTSDINTLLTTLFNKLNADSIIVSNRFTISGFDNLIVYKDYKMDVIDSHLIKSCTGKKLILVDCLSVTSGTHYNHLLKIIKEAKEHNTIVIVLRKCNDDVRNIISYSNHVTLLDTVDNGVLESMYNYLNVKDIFTSTESFLSIFKQLTSKFGAMVISSEINSTSTISWLRT